MPPLLSLLLGLIALLVGGELLVRGAVAAARRLGVSPMLIGLTLVGFGTSMPELLTSLQAAWTGAPGIAVGNVVGSNIANVLLILGAAALLRPIAVDPAALKRDAGMMIAAALAGAGALLLLGGVGRSVGAVFVLALAVYIVWTYRLERANGTPSAELHAEEAAAVGSGTLGLVPALGLALGGLALTLLGAAWLVDGAVWLARAAGVSEGVIGLTVVAVGTSLPELTAAITAVRRGHGEVAFGNVVGSNVYNVLGILGVTGLVVPLPLPAGVTAADLAIMLASCVLVLPLALTGRRIGRAEGAALLLLYLLYVGYLAT